MLNQLLYGAAYYTEYMPHERLEQDMSMMKSAGFNHPNRGIHMEYLGTPGWLF